MMGLMAPATAAAQISTAAISPPKRQPSDAMTTANHKGTGTCSDLTGIRTGLLASRCHKDAERDVMNIRTASSLILLFSVCLLMGCGKNVNPPSHITDVVAYKEGYKAFVVYFVLVDALGKETAYDGEVQLEIVETEWTLDGSVERKLFSWEKYVSSGSFYTTTVGKIKTLQRKRLLCSLGRIKYSSFEQQPTQISGEVRLWFTPKQGKKLYGEAPVFFDVD